MKEVIERDRTSLALLRSEAPDRDRVSLPADITLAGSLSWWLPIGGVVSRPHLCRTPAVTRR